MATLNIGGRRVTVDDSFRTLTPEQQQATVDEISGSIPAAPTSAAPAPAPTEQPQFNRVSPQYETPPDAPPAPQGNAYDDPNDPRFNGGLFNLPVVGSPLKSFSKFSAKFDRGLADVLSGSLFDEASSALNYFAPGTYEEKLAQSRKELADSGGAGTAGQLAGAIMSPGSGWKAAAAKGGAYGFGSGEGGLPNRLGNAAIGGTIGGALGAPGTVLSPVLKATKNVMSRSIPRTIAEQALGSTFYGYGGNIIVPAVTHALEAAWPPIASMGKKAITNVGSKLPPLPASAKSLIDILRDAAPQAATTPATHNDFKGTNLGPQRKNSKNPPKGLLDYLLQ